MAEQRQDILNRARQVAQSTQTPMSPPGSVPPWMQSIMGMADVIRPYQERALETIRSAYPPGTPTLAMRQFQEGQRQFDEQLREGQRQFDITASGRFLPAQTQELLNTLVNLKEQNEAIGKASDQYQANVDRANQIRNQLYSMGLDASLFGPNVTAEQAARNIANVYTPTLTAQRGVMDVLLNTGMQMPVIPSGMGDVAATLPAYSGLSGYLNQLGGRLPGAQSRFESGLNVEVDQNLQRQIANESTQFYIGQLSNAASREDAMNYIRDNLAAIASSGADVRAIFNVLDLIFPPTREGGGTTDPDRQSAESFIYGSAENPR